MYMNNLINLDDVFKEVYSVLTFSDQAITDKIPTEIYQDILERAANSTLEPKIDMDKSLLEQDISQEGKDLLSLLYYSFVCNEEEKKNLFRIWEGN